MEKERLIHFPTDFFDSRVVKQVEELKHGDELLVFFFKLWMEIENAKHYTGKNYFSVRNIRLTDELIEEIFELKHWKAQDALKILSDYGMIVREERKLIVIPFWIEKRDTTTEEYYFWRKSVYLRDNYTCQHCGSKKELQAHHIIPWKNTKNRKWLRYDIDNGITLCRSCHLKAHGGSWR